MNSPDRASPYQRGRIEEPERTVYCVLSTLMTCIHTEMATSELTVIARWMRRHGITATEWAGRLRQDPFQYLDAKVGREQGVFRVQVVAEPVLEAQGSLFVLTDIDDDGGDRNG